MKMYLLPLFLSAAFGAVAGEGGTHYEVLGVPVTAEPKEIEAAFKRRRFAVHPDRNSDDPKKAQAEFILVNTAYKILSSSMERNKYDQELQRRGLFRPKSAADSEGRPAASRPSRRQTDPPYNKVRAEEARAVNELLSAAARGMARRVDTELHGQYRYSQGFRDERYWRLRNEMDRDLQNMFSVILMGAAVRTGRELVIPPDSLNHFPRAVSLLAERGADLKSAIEGSLRVRDPSAFRTLIDRDPALINTKTQKKQTPLFHLVLKKIADSRNEAQRHYGRPSCPPSCYESWRATAAGWNEVADEILREGQVDLSSRDARGQTALMVAVRHNLEIGGRIIQEGGLTESDRHQLKLAALKNNNTDILALLNTTSGGELRPSPAPSSGTQRLADSHIKNDALGSLRAFRRVASEELGRGDPAVRLKGPEQEGEDCRSGFFRRLMGKE